jgi:DNA primase
VSVAGSVGSALSARNTPRSFRSTPPFKVYKCFGCGVASDVIKFVQEIEGLTSWEAAKLLAEQHGIPLPKQTEHPKPEVW